MKKKYSNQFKSLREKEFSTEDIKLGQFKRLELGKGIETTNYGYVFMVKNGDFYYNPFDEFGEYFICQRIPYSNMTKDGEEYGTKSVPLQNKDKMCDGPCIVLNIHALDSYFGKKRVKYSTLESIILNSKKFFKDYEYVVSNQDYNAFKKMRLLKKHESEIKKLEELFESEKFQLKK